MSAPAVWVTGADGFVGQWVLRALADRNLPAAVILIPGVPAPAGIPFTHLDLRKAAVLPTGSSVLDLNSLPPPRALLHLAALSFPPECEKNPDQARQINVLGPTRLYEQILGEWPQLPVLHVSSGQIYGSRPGQAQEEDPIAPQNVYGTTKLEAEGVALGFRDRGHCVSVVRPFNHAGPGQMPYFALPSFALRLAELARVGGGDLDVGRLDSIRDFLHVREIARAYLDLLEKTADFDVVNVGSGEGHVMADLLAELISAFGIPVQVHAQEDRLRGTQDVNRLVADVTRLKGVLGRVPELDRGALLGELAVDARQRVAAGEDLSLA